jgi:endonuclease/exonuclease/phosphatase family metal-dependent hydrolase
MKLLSLNIQGGAQSPRFLQYVRKQKANTDIFCFQEIFNSKIKQLAKNGERTDILKELKKILPEFNVYYSATSSQVHKYFALPGKTEEGLGIFVKKHFTVLEHKSKHLVKHVNFLVDFSQGKEAVQAQWLKIKTSQESFWVMNFHGLSRPGDKLDTKARLKQSRDLVKIMKSLKGPKILCGDFNLMPNTESVKIIERAGLVNLIKKYKIKNTRNSVSWKRYNNIQNFADFTFVSPEIQIKSFKVPYNLASDHLPMIVDYKIAR